MRSRTEKILAEGLRVQKLERLLIVACSTAIGGSALGVAFLSPYVLLNAQRSRELQELREAPVVERLTPPAAVPAPATSERLRLPEGMSHQALTLDGLGRRR